MKLYLPKFYLVLFLLALHPNCSLFAAPHASLYCIQDISEISFTTFLFMPQNPEKTGSIQVESMPEDGMSIYIDGKNTGLQTPATISGLTLGSHKVMLMHPYYAKQEQTVVVGENTGQLKFTMTAIYANITIRTTNDAVIYIDKKPVGTTSWSGRMVEGEHLVRVEKDGYYPRDQKVPVVRRRDMQVDLMLTPKKGAMEIITEPAGAMVSIDGRMYGLTPKVIDDLPLGTYNVTIEKLGYTSIVKRISLTDSGIQVFEFNLASGKEVTIISDAPDVQVYINDEYKGLTPLKIWLQFGSHNVKVQKDSYNTIETIQVTHGGAKEFSIELGIIEDPFSKQMVLVKGGTFKMGDEVGRGNKEEKPVHSVTLSDYYIGKFEVTQAQWEQIMGENPSHFSGCPSCPVERVSWIEVQTFIEKLNQLSGKNYRLPTEAEWEYAAKGGNKSGGFIYSGRNNVNFVAWHSGNSGSKPNPVGQKEPNELGLYDMSGNVWEWVSDWFNYFTDSPKTDPTGPEDGDFRVVKGGSWFGNIATNRVSCRGSDEPVNKRSYVGFRIAISAKDM